MELGKTGLQLDKQGFGCMSISEFYGKPLEDSQAISLIKAAYRNGINFFDTADMYGFGRNEVLVGKAIAELIAEGTQRNQLVLSSKCGLIRDEHDLTKRDVSNSYDYIKDCCEKSLTRLGNKVQYIDLYYLHRIANDGAELDEAMRAMAELLNEGKIKAVGLSEAKPGHISLANGALLKYTNGKHQLAAIQSEYSLLTRTIEENGVLNLCRQLGITFVAYSPLSRALLTGEVEDPQQFEVTDFRRALPRFQTGNFEKNKLIVNQLKEISARKNCTAAQLALAWVIQQNVVPIPGTTKEAHLLSNIAANKVRFTAEELEKLNTLETASGYRYTEDAMKVYGFDDELS
jgi:aryl-alcohol dehydrogenase-like predicted oxidoreductase